MKRFWEKVNRRGPIPPQQSQLGCCWIWTAHQTPFGYGWVQYRRRDGEWRPMLAHRLAWLLHHGRAPAKQVLHKCDNPACVRPSHLYTGTQAENVRDMIQKGRGKNLSNMPRDQRGSRNPGAVLTEKQVAQLRRDRANGYTLRQLATKYKYRDISSLSKICRRLTWKHVAGETT